MKVYLVFGFVISAIIAIALSKRCHPDDLSACSGMACSDNNTVVGCEHEVCTCVVSFSCLDKPDCNGREHDLHCKHDESPHCLDRQCACIKDEHHGPGPHV